MTKDNFVSQLTTKLTNNIYLIVNNRDEKTGTRAKYDYLNILASESKQQQNEVPSFYVGLEHKISISIHPFRQMSVSSNITFLYFTNTL
jgi:hypothetical protein